MIENPSWILWTLDRPAPTGPLAAVADHARRCLDRFDRRPFVETCYGDECEVPATRVSLFANSHDPYFWCASCNPYSRGADPGRLKITSTYRGVLDHVKSYIGTKDALRYTADLLVAAKGLRKPRTDTKLVTFYSK